MRRASQDGVLRIAASVYLATVLLGFTNAATVQPVVSTERPVFYRWGFWHAPCLATCMLLVHSSIADTYPFLHWPLLAD